MNTITNDSFLQAIFQDNYQFAHVTGFVEPPEDMEKLGIRHYWAGDVWSNQQLENPNANNFFTISIFNPSSDGKQHRRKADYFGTYCIVIDDVGEGGSAKITQADLINAGAPTPSWILETSPGNYQFGYIIQPEYVRGRVEHLLNSFIALGLTEDGSDPGMSGVTRYVRLPVGSNTKKKYGGWVQVLHSWQPELIYTIDALAEAFKIDMMMAQVIDKQLPAPLEAENDPILQSLMRLGNYNFTKGVGEHDITCPWADQHTDRVESGSMYFSPGGYKCHHGHCLEKSGKDLKVWLRNEDPEYLTQCEASEIDPGQVFLPVETAAAVLVNETLKQLNDQITMLLGGVNDGNKLDTARSVLKLAVGLDKVGRENAVARVSTFCGLTKRVASEQLGDYARMQRLAGGIQGVPAWIQLNDAEKPLAILANFKAILDFENIQLRYNMMNATVVPFFKSGMVMLSDEEENITLSTLQDMASIHDMPTHRVGEHALVAATENAYHPFIEHLDGVGGTVNPEMPYLKKLMGMIDCKDREFAEKFIRKWLISVIAAVRGHGGKGIRGVLVLAGPQGCGKTSFFRYLVPDGMFNEGVNFDAHNKDSRMAATKFLVTELGEIDATFRASDKSALKNFISKPMDVDRAPFARKESHRQRRTAFCGTVNDIEFLRDATGSSRFYPVEVRSIDLPGLDAMGKDGSMSRMWKEVDALYDTFMKTGDPDFSWYMDDAEMLLLSTHSERFQEVSPEEQWMMDMYDFDRFNLNAPTKQNPMTISMLKDKCGTGSNPQAIRRLKDAIAKLTGQKQAVRAKIDNKVHRVYYMPGLRGETLALGLVEKLGNSPPVKTDDFL